MRREPFALLAAVAAAGAVATATTPARDFDSLRAAAERTRAQLADKLVAQERGLRDRVRTLYKLTAFGDLPLWVDDAARAQALIRRGAARRIILRDLEERRLLRAELAAVDQDLERLDAEAARARELAARPLREGCLLRPVDGNVVASFGIFGDERTHVRLLRRGVELAAHDPSVVATAAGQVSFAGPLRGLGTVVIIDHGQGLVTVTAGLAAATVERGRQVAAGERIGRAAGRIGFEVRRAGRPVDPFPLLRAKR